VLQPHYARLGTHLHVFLFQENTLGQTLHVFPGHASLGLDTILTLMLESGMGETVRQLTVVGQEEQSFTFKIQPPDRVDSPLHVDQVQHGRPAVGIADGRDITGRLIEHDVDLGLFRLDAAAIHFNHILHRIHPGPQCGDNLVVDSDAARLYHCLSFTPGGNAGVCQDFLEAFFHNV